EAEDGRPVTAQGGRQRGLEVPGIEATTDLRLDLPRIVSHPRRVYTRSGTLFPGMAATGYELLCLLGSGAQGEVWVAFDERLQRAVALKLLRADSPTDAARFQREARAQARVVHEGVCPVYEIGEHQGRAFIAMRLIDGPNLAKAAPTLALADKVQIVHDLALALHEAHRHNVIHRDLKPGNVLLEALPDGRWRPMLTDFGLARDLRDGDLTVPGAIVGTPAYMSPEQARGDARVVDRRTDVYSLGATLYELLVGRPPFTGASPLDV